MAAHELAIGHQHFNAHFVPFTQADSTAGPCACQHSVGWFSEWCLNERRHDTSARRLFRQSVDEARTAADGIEAAGGVKTLLVWAHQERTIGNLALVRSHSLPALTHYIPPGTGFCVPSACWLPTSTTICCPLTCSAAQPCTKS